MEPLDLRIAPPRSPRVQLAGLFFTARVIDKLRATLPGGDSNGYFAFSGFSELWSYRTGIPLTDLLSTIANASREADVERWIEKRTATIDRTSVNVKMECFDTGRTPADLRDVFERTYPAALRERYTNLFDLLEADDRRLYVLAEKEAT
jgi:hypothetical protein